MTLKLGSCCNWPGDGMAAFLSFLSFQGKYLGFFYFYISSRSNIEYVFNEPSEDLPKYVLEGWTFHTCAYIYACIFWV